MMNILKVKLNKQKYHIGLYQRPVLTPEPIQLGIGLTSLNTNISHAFLFVQFVHLAFGIQ